MIEISHKTAATVTLSPASTLDLHDLPAIVRWLLGQADVKIHRLDLCLTGESIDYITDHGSVTLSMCASDDGQHRIAIVCNTLVRGDCETGRQLAFQIVRRLIARTDVASVFWTPTRQRLQSDDFTWGRLNDAPQRLAS